MKPTHAVLVSDASGSVFWKDYDFFVSQGGLSQKWGSSWVLVKAETDASAVAFAMTLPGARAGLYCPLCCRDKWKCGSAKIGSCVAPPKAVRVER